MVTKKTTGKDFNYFKLVTINDTTYPDESQCTINVKNIQSFSLVNYGSATVYYSFNGNTDHGDMRPGTSTAAIFFDNRTPQSAGIWFRTDTPGQEVRIEAWSKTL